MASKDKAFTITFENGKTCFRCDRCRRILSSKRSVLHHLHSAHNMSPVKRVKKLYLEDATITVPRTTLSRRNHKVVITEELNDDDVQCSCLGVTENYENGEINENTEKDPIYLNQTTGCDDIDRPDLLTSNQSGDLSYTEFGMERMGKSVMEGVEQHMEQEGCDDIGRPDLLTSNQSGDLSYTEFGMERRGKSVMEGVEQHMEQEGSDSEDGIAVDDDSMEHEKTCVVLSEQGATSINEENEVLSDVSDVSLGTISGDSDCLTSDTDESEYSDTNSSDITDSASECESECSNDSHFESVSQLTNEFGALKLLASFHRHNLTAIACKDITDTLKSIFQGAEHSHILNYEYLMSFVEKYPIKEVHYCESCFEVFPDNIELVRCSTENCTGCRFNRDGQPRKCFIFADIKNQLKDLLQSPGVMKEIQKQKLMLDVRKELDDGTITDISDGLIYREILNDFQDEDAFLLTALLNTDGVNLYSSSKVELWPIFLAINELSPKARFSRDNLLLVGIWQGKGKPPFKSYFKSLSDQLNILYNDGINISKDGDNITVKLRVVGGVFDLPAKAAILKMMYFNGQYACITCEEPGRVVKQGKGTSRCFPYRNGQYQMRSNESVLECMEQGTLKKPVKGFKGFSGLIAIEAFDLVEGILPDYMHGVLLGVTKMLLSKWFSPTQSKKDYFIGKDLKTISSRLQHIQPPSCIERLPRDLEKHYQSLKATELQAWLLFYCIPCLMGILPDKYLNHFSCLSEAIYILLGDSITAEKLERAGNLLEIFYASFNDLYGLGSCGLNVHNTCAHLIHYVKMWGPLWAWSCFGFEDNNAMLLQAVHGTGIVTKQIMLCKQVESTLRRKTVKVNLDSRSWKITYKAHNCDVCGKMVPYDMAIVNPNVLENLEIVNENDVKIIERISLNGKQFCSSLYKRMKKRICSYVLYDEQNIGYLKYFVLVVSSNFVYAIIEKFEAVNGSLIAELTGGKHILPVKKTGVNEVKAISSLVDTLVYVNTCPEVQECVVLMPSRHGHSIFK